MGVGASLDRVALFDLLVEEGVEAILACSERVDLSHRPEYRKPRFTLACGERRCEAKRGSVRIMNSLLAKIRSWFKTDKK
jgi:hypothetical protein